MLIFYFSSNIPLYIETNPMEKFCMILEMELKMYTPVSPRIFFTKIRFKFLHYIQHDFICQCLGLSKDQASMFKCFVNFNYFDRRLWNTLTDTFWWLYQRQQIFLFYKSRYCRCYLKIKLFYGCVLDLNSTSIFSAPYFGC